MKITRVRVCVAQLPNNYGRGLPPAMPLGVLSIETDQGIIGETFIGVPGPGPAFIGEQIIKLVGPRLVGRDPLDIGAIWHELGDRSRQLDPTVQGYVDVALWDILGKATAMPVHRLLGSVRRTVPAYVSSWHHHHAEEYAEEALAYAELGVSPYKLHPPSCGRLFGDPPQGPDADVLACSAVRRAVGNQVPLFLDPAWGYDYASAIRVGRAIQDLDYTWYEDPLPASDLDAYVRLKQQLYIPIMATEATIGGLKALAPWVTSRATDFLRGDVVIKGGITGMMKIAHLAEAFGMNCEVHDAYNGLNNVATLHVAAALRNCAWFEIITINPPGHYGFDHLNAGLAEPIVIERGEVVVPQAPGLGVPIDWDLLRSCGLTELAY